MSLIGSISTAVTGMNAQSSSLGNISDNLSNTTTAGFKSIGTSFKDIFSSTDTVENTGLGALAAPVYYNNIQGALSSNYSDTSMAISGKGFFTVAGGGATGGADTYKIYYTRAGDFLLDNNCFMKNSAGFYLMGWSVDQTTGQAAAGTLVPVQFSDYIISDATKADTDPTKYSFRGSATTTTNYNAILPASVPDTTTTSGSQITVYDSNAAAHNVSYSWTKTAANTWDLTVTAAGGAYDAATNTANDLTGTASFVFDSTGHVQNITSADFAVTGTSLAIPVTYQGAQAQTITSNFDKLTQFAGTELSFNEFSQNGAANGSFKSVSIDENGLTSVNYDNGVSRILFQIPLANFNSAEELQRATGTVFQQTLMSGTPFYSAAGTNGAGKIVVGSLENSTVDIADQFSRMIQAQRAYSANAKTVSTADTMMQTLVTI